MASKTEVSEARRAAFALQAQLEHLLYPLVGENELSQMLKLLRKLVALVPEVPLPVTTTGEPVGSEVYPEGTTALRPEKWVEGKSLWWANLCSCHMQYDPSCLACRVGRWVHRDRDAVLAPLAVRMAFHFTRVHIDPKEYYSNGNPYRAGHFDPFLLKKMEELAKEISMVANAGEIPDA